MMIKNDREYKAVMKKIELILTRATKAGNFHELSPEEVVWLANHSKRVEAYEDNALRLMPIK